MLDADFNSRRPNRRWGLVVSVKRHSAIQQGWSPPKEYITNVKQFQCQLHLKANLTARMVQTFARKAKSANCRTLSATFRWNVSTFLRREFSPVVPELFLVFQYWTIWGSVDHLRPIVPKAKPSSRLSGGCLNAGLAVSSNRSSLTFQSGSGSVSSPWQRSRGRPRTPMT